MPLGDHRCVEVDVIAGMQRDPENGLAGFLVHGTYVGGSFEPLAAIHSTPSHPLPDELKDLVMVIADTTHPLVLSLWVVAAEEVAAMAVDLSCRLRFTLPAFLNGVADAAPTAGRRQLDGARTMEMDVLAWGVVASVGTPKLGFGPVLLGEAFLLPVLGIEVKEGYLSVSTFDATPYPSKPLGRDGPLVEVPFGFTLHYIGPSVLPEVTTKAHDAQCPRTLSLPCLRCPCSSMTSSSLHVLCSRQICPGELLFALSLQGAKAGRISAACPVDLTLLDRRRNVHRQSGAPTPVTG